MKIVGLITEYNPFHNGHLYHIQEALRATGSDAAVAIMSGNYVQRGAPALMPKHLRARMALEAGVAAVIELPVWCACGSAEYFRRRGRLHPGPAGLCGCDLFWQRVRRCLPAGKAARITAQEPEAYRGLLKEGLRDGLSFPRARQKALSLFLGDDRAGEVLAEPNNILGVEYIKAILQQKSSLASARSSAGSPATTTWSCPTHTALPPPSDITSGRRTSPASPRSWRDRCPLPLSAR